jgi:DNA mismatch repair ATPase MutS
VNCIKYDRKKYVQFIERVFAYELYHQFRIIMDSFPQLYGHLVLNGEVRKNGFNESIICKNHIYPDLVLHRNQTTKSKDSQKLFIEIKSKSFSNEQLENDFKKLLTAVSERLNFEEAVFISINLNPKDVLNELKKVINKIQVSPSELEKIWFLSDEGLINMNDYIFEI